ncbi:MAG: hypothetical protein KAQ96_07585, partial [Thermoplasmata archaeon]|nr:hypothetical protein [Thermoplasmata archaeon]
ILDTVAPMLSISSPDEGEWTSDETVMVKGTTEPGARLDVNGEPVDVSTGSFSFPFTLEESDVLIVVTAVDPAGNVAILTRSVRVDRTPPVLEIIDPVDGYVTNERIMQMVGTTSDEAPVMVLVQGHPAVIVGTDWFKELLLAEGPNEVYVEAIDAAGNTATERLVVRLDTRAPIIKVTVTVDDISYDIGGVTIITTASQAGFEFTADEGVTVEVVGRTTFPMTAGRLNKTFPLEEGLNRFTFLMRDEGGNEAGPFIFTIERDTVPPDILITYPFGDLITDEHHVFIRGITEADADVNVSGIEATVYHDGTFETLSPLKVGPNSIIITVSDVANNSASKSMEVFREDEGGTEPVEVVPILFYGILGIVLGIILTIVVTRYLTK